MNSINFGMTAVNATGPLNALSLACFWSLAQSLCKSVILPTIGNIQRFIRCFQLLLVAGVLCLQLYSVTSSQEFVADLKAASTFKGVNRRLQCVRFQFLSRNLVCHTPMPLSPYQPPGMSLLPSIVHYRNDKHWRHLLPLHAHRPDARKIRHLKVL
jgi:hypothetical protein